ncbi:MAG: multicopper oxidase family protein [Burkholderiaceae bacterium]
MNQMGRRRFNQSVLGLSAALTLPTSTRAKPSGTLTARVGLARLVPEGYPETQIWGYDGRVPGPVLRVVRGERLSLRFVNQLPQASSVHWHGIRIDNAMDGVIGLTQQAVEPGASFDIDFVAPDAGTYWYHSHNRSWEQVARGLYGALIVTEPDGAPEVDLDEPLLIDDWRLADDAQIATGFGSLHDAAHAGRIGNWITVNGDPAWSREVARLARLRLRVVNAANARIVTIGMRGFEGWVVALDGMPLDQPAPIEELDLAPAQRADLILDVVADVGDEAILTSLERDGGFVLCGFPVRGQARSERRPPPAPLPANDVPAIADPAGARAVELRMEGGAMGGLHGAMMDGRMLDMRALASAGKVWAFNGTAGMEGTPLVDVVRGEVVKITIINDTAWPHAMHLHGHHFRQVPVQGPPGPLRDTLLVNRRETTSIAFVADNPGKWLLHCHMLEHAAAGMMTWLRVT